MFWTDINVEKPPTNRAIFVKGTRPYAKGQIGLAFAEYMGEGSPYYQGIQHHHHIVGTLTGGPNVTHWMLAEMIIGLPTADEYNVPTPMPKAELALLYDTARSWQKTLGDLSIYFTFSERSVLNKEDATHVAIMSLFNLVLAMAKDAYPDIDQPAKFAVDDDA